MSSLSQPLLSQEQDATLSDFMATSTAADQTNGEEHLPLAASLPLCSNYTFVGGIPTFVLRPEGGSFTCHAFSQNGRRFAAGSTGRQGRGILRLWDAAEFEELAQWENSAGVLRECSFINGTSDQLAIVDTNGIYTELVSDAATGHLSCTRSLNLAAELGIPMNSDTGLHFSFSATASVLAFRSYQSKRPSETRSSAMANADRIYICRFSQEGLQSTSLFLDQRVGGFELSKCGKHILMMSGQVWQPNDLPVYNMKTLHSRISLDLIYEGPNCALKLHGAIAKWVSKGTAILTFSQHYENEQGDTDRGTGPKIYLYHTKSIKKTHATNPDLCLPPQREISLERHIFVLDVCLSLGHSADDSLKSRRLFVLCGVPWSTQQVIVTVDVGSEQTLSVFETQMPYTDSDFRHDKEWFGGNVTYFTDSKYLAFLKRYLKTPRLALSPEGNWLIYKNLKGSQERQVAVLFSLESQVPILSFQSVFTQSLSEDGSWQRKLDGDKKGWCLGFDPTGERVLFVSSKGLIVYIPWVLSRALPREQMAEVEAEWQLFEFHDALRNTPQLSPENGGPSEGFIAKVLMLYKSKYGDETGEVSGAISLLSSEANDSESVSKVKIYVASSGSYIALRAKGLNCLMLLNLKALQTGSSHEACLQRRPLGELGLRTGFFVKMAHVEDFFLALLRTRMPDQNSTIVVWLDLSSFEEFDRVELPDFDLRGAKLDATQSHLILAEKCCRIRLDLQNKETERIDYSMALLDREIGRCCDFLSDDGRRYAIGWNEKHQQLIHVQDSTSKEEHRQLMASLRDSEERLKVWWVSKDWSWMLLSIETQFSHRVMLHDPREELESCPRQITWLKNATKHTHLEAKGTQVPQLGFLRRDCRYTLSNQLAMKKLAFSPWAFDRALPSYRRIELSGSKSDKALIVKLIAEFGWCLVNRSDGQGKSFLQRAIEDGNVYLATQLMECAVTANIPLNLLWKDGDQQMNALESGIKQRSREMIELVLKHLLAKTAPAEQTATVFKQSLYSLQIYFPDIFENLITQSTVAVEIGRFPVQAIAFSKTTHGALIRTTDAPSDWLRGGDRCSSFWKTVAKDHFVEDVAPVEAVAKLVCIQDAAKVGMKGILRPLLMARNLPVKLFESDIVKWIVDYKWHTFWRKRCIRHILYYLVFLLTFTMYAVFVGTDGPSSMNTLTGLASQGLPLTLCSVLTLRNLVLEYRQFRRLQLDAAAMSGRSKRYVSPYFNSAKNLIELCAYTLILVPVPVLHGLATQSTVVDHMLSAAIAVEAILLWFKLLYWALAFQATGPLVTMIQNVLADILAFVALASMVLFGFGVAFFVLLRHSLTEQTSNELPQDLYESPDFQASFGGLDKSLATLFYAMIGDFDVEIYRRATALSWLTTVFFTVYMGAMMIVLLNLLIAIMGDTYDRVKMTESAEMIRCRAAVIDDCEACMSDREIQQMDAQIGKYLHVLLPAEANKNQESSEWHGRIFDIERTLKDAINELSNRQGAALKVALDNISSKVDAKDEEIRQQSTRISELTDRVDQMQRGMDSRMQSIESALNSILEQLRHQGASTSAQHES